jgi:hypothetical protein
MILWRQDELAVSRFVTTLGNIVHYDRLPNCKVAFQFGIVVFSCGNNEDSLTNVLKFYHEVDLFTVTFQYSSKDMKFTDPVIRDGK